ncbi:hypothetical protein JM658_01200 [Joostella atrarenae]|uniref:Uncharacterized protein n=1 Tax=Joostella atrarenae TaxID=679257 RepID=A0ABS9IZ26_9FLAO|nr:hypothetical protein [Joostella atrarenae]MCF8713431.1 hypothetical protein [Joostella atrarenae]
MKTIYLKTRRFSFVFFIFSLTISQLSCEKEIIEDNGIINSSNLNNKIQFKDLPDDIKQVAIYYGEQFSKKNNYNSKNDEVIYNTEVNILKKATQTSYTIAIPKDKKGFYYDNIVVEKSNDGELKTTIIRYTPEKKWFFANMINNFFDYSTYTGEITLYDSQGSIILSKTFQNGKPLIKDKKFQNRWDCIQIGVQYAYLEQNGVLYLNDVLIEYECTYDNENNPTGGNEGGGGGNNQSSGSINTSPTGEENSEDYEILLETLSAADSFEEKIDDSLLKGCLKSILRDLKNIKNGVGNTIIKFSGNEPGFNWKVIDGSLAGGTGQTSSVYDDTKEEISSTFDTQAFPLATDLSWARTILHESIHAFLITEFEINRPNWIATYPQMVDEWGKLQNWNSVHHEEIARSIVKDIATSLKEYGAAKGYNLPDQFYEDMSWAGLQNTTTFNNLPLSDQKRILNVISIELTKKDTNGNTRTQKGKNAGC